MKTIAIHLILWSVFSSYPASAENMFSASSMLDNCENFLNGIDGKDFEMDKSHICVGYVIAIGHSMLALRMASGGLMNSKCKPMTGSYADNISMVVDYIRNHPEDSNEHAFKSVSSAYSEAFPCKEKNEVITQSQSAIPLSSAEILEKNDSELFLASYQSYICSFIMITDMQMNNEGLFLRRYSEDLFNHISKGEGQINWNQVNFPAASVAISFTKEHKNKMFLDGGECNKLFNFAKISVDSD